MSDTFITIIAIFLPIVRLWLILVALINLTGSAFDINDTFKTISLPKGCVIFEGFSLIPTNNQPIIIHKLTLTKDGETGGYLFDIVGNEEGQRLILNRWVRTVNGKYERGDIITFEAPSKVYVSSAEADLQNPVAEYKHNINGIFSKFKYYVLEVGKDSYIKRVIATEGDHVVIKENTVYVNGKAIDESEYLSEDVVTDAIVFNDFIVPEDCVFCMGDNRVQSTDCRDFGCIPLEKIEGIVVFRFWPFNSWGKID